MEGNIPQIYTFKGNSVAVATHNLCDYLSFSFLAPSKEGVSSFFVPSHLFLVVGLCCSLPLGSEPCS